MGSHHRQRQSLGLGADGLRLGAPASSCLTMAQSEEIVPVGQGATGMII